MRYAVAAAADPIATRVCWCRDCQYLAAGSATVNVVFPTSAVTLTGALRDYTSIADSGNRMHRQFCERCGTPVTSSSEARPHLTILRAGTLDVIKIEACVRSGRIDRSNEHQSY
ncbi:MAG: GFA family protein [Steroidobacteraceae bacterium]